MGSPYWMKTLINKTFSQRFLLSKLSHYPIIGRLIEYVLFEGDDIIYLPKDNVIDVNASLGEKEDLVLPSQILEHFIQKSSFRWIMDFCICRDSSGCKDYPIDLGCLFLGDAAKKINPKFGRSVSIEEALDYAARCREAGLVHLIGRNKLDTVWLNVGPGEKLLTVCSCCPCCCLWKVLPVITPEIGSKISRIPGITVSVSDKCVACGTCTKDVCFVEAIQLGDKQAVINQAECRGCGRCVQVCPAGAIDLIIEEKTYISDSINRISELVDVC